MIKNVAAIVADLPTWGVISITGKDANKFLQGQITQDMTQLTTSEAALASYLTPKGRVIATFIILQQQVDGYYLLMPQPLLQTLINKLSKYALFSKVDIQNISASYHVLAQWQSEKHARWEIQLPTQNSIKITVANSTMSLHLVETTHYPQYRQTLASTHTFVHETVSTLTCIQAGIPFLEPENTEVFTIHDLNLHELNAVSFKKGCYTGQEIVARMHYKAKLKHHLYIIKFNDVFQNNQLFIDSNRNEVGRIINGIESEGDYYALVWLRDAMLDAPYLETPEQKQVTFTIIK